MCFLDWTDSLLCICSRNQPRIGPLQMQACRNLLHTMISFSRRLHFLEVGCVGYGEAGLLGEYKILCCWCSAWGGAGYWESEYSPGRHSLNLLFSPSAFHFQLCKLVLSAGPLLFNSTSTVSFLSHDLQVGAWLGQFTRGTELTVLYTRYNWLPHFMLLNSLSSGAAASNY